MRCIEKVKASLKGRRIEAGPKRCAGSTLSAYFDASSNLIETLAQGFELLQQVVGVIRTHFLELSLQLFDPAPQRIDVALSFALAEQTVEGGFDPAVQGIYVGSDAGEDRLQSYSTRVGQPCPRVP